MEKITPEKAIELMKKLDKSTWDANPFYLASNCFVEIRNGEEIIFDKDVTDGKIKPFFLPKKEINIENQGISCAFEEDLDLLEKLGFEIKKKELFGEEYFYRTKDIIEMKGSHFRSFRKHINQFEKTYKYKILSDYPKEKVVESLNSWLKERNLDDKSEEAKRNREFEFAQNIKWLNFLDKIPNKRIFIEIDGKLAGFAVFLKMNNALWLALMQKADHNYKGITRFLYYLKAKEMKDIEFFTTGLPGQDKGLIDFKEGMRPIKKVSVYVLEVGKRKK